MIIEQLATCIELCGVNSKGTCSGVARQLCARGRAMKLAPPAPSLFFQIFV